VGTKPPPQVEAEDSKERMNLQGHLQSCSSLAFFAAPETLQPLARVRVEPVAEAQRPVGLRRVCRERSEELERRHARDLLAGRAADRAVGGDHADLFAPAVLGG